MIRCVIVYKKKDEKIETKASPDTKGVKEKASAFKKPKNIVLKIRKKERFEWYCREWLKNRSNRLKESTLVKYGNIISKHIIPILGELFPDEIGKKRIKLFTDELLSTKKLSPKTVKDVLTVLKSIMNYSGNLSFKDIASADLFYSKETKKEMRVLTINEQKVLTEYLYKDMDRSKFGVTLALFTGLRIGELCALKWKDISLKDGTVRVHSTIQRIKNTEKGCNSKTKIIISEPKSDNSVRTIPLTGELLTLCQKFYDEDGDAYVLSGNKSYVEPRTLQYRLKKYTDECGLIGVHFHSLRHTFATRCIEAEFDIKSLSEILGHASTKITLDRYVHSSLEQKRRNMEKLWKKI